MAILKSIILFLLFLFIGWNTAIAQTDTTSRHEFNISPAYYLGSVNKVSADSELEEQGTGYGVAAGYSIFFRWVGFSVNYYYHQCEFISTPEMALGYESISSSEYKAHGITGGVHLNIPLTKNKFKSYLHAGFDGGIFLAQLPEQQFNKESGFVLTSYEYNAAENTGITNHAVFGFKADIAKHFSLALNYNLLFERAVVERDSYGMNTEEYTQFYKWNYNYRFVDLTFSYNFSCGNQ